MPFISISFIDSLNGWGASLTENDMYKTTDGGKTWLPQRAFSIFLNKVKFINNNHGFAIGETGDILTTTTGGVTSVKEESNITVSDNFILYQNYPNPFNPTTTINYQIPKYGMVTIKIYDILGREIKTLVNEYKPAGRYNITFNASNLASGVYFYRLQAGEFTETKKLLLLK